MNWRDSLWEMGSVNLGPIKNEFFYEEPLKTKYYKNEKGNYVIEVPVPGFNKDNVEIVLKKNCVEVKGDTKTRTLNKNVFVDNKVSDVKATVQDGLLLMTLVYKDCEESKKIPVN